MCIFTLVLKSTYKGSPDDYQHLNLFLKINNVWKIRWMQRSTGNSDLDLWDWIS